MEKVYIGSPVSRTQMTVFLYNIVIEYSTISLSLLLCLTYTHTLSLSHTHTHTHTQQAENIQSEIQKLRELINQSESIILINLDSQRNVMLRLSLQLEMGMFAAAFAGLIGMAFGMNLDSSLEEVSQRYIVSL